MLLAQLLLVICPFHTKIAMLHLESLLCSDVLVFYQICSCYNFYWSYWRCWFPVNFLYWSFLHLFDYCKRSFSLSFLPHVRGNWHAVIKMTAWTSAMHNKSTKHWKNIFLIFFLIKAKHCPNLLLFSFTSMKKDA